jgi:hypothetical protein
LEHRPPRLVNSAADVLRKPTICHPPAAAKLKLEVMSGCSLENKPPRLERFLHHSEHACRLAVLLCCPIARQRYRLKTLLLPYVSPPRNPKTAPAKKKHQESIFANWFRKVDTSARNPKSHGTGFFAPGPHAGEYLLKSCFRKKNRTPLQLFLFKGKEKKRGGNPQKVFIFKKTRRVGGPPPRPPRKRKTRNAA